MNLILDRAISIVKAVLWIPKALNIADGETYYPEMTRKGKFKRFTDNILWILKYGEVNRFYNLYGMDVVERNDLYGSYCDYRSFMKRRNNLNYGQFNHPQTSILRDKFMFYQYMSAMGIPVPKVFAVKKGSKLFDSKLNTLAEDVLRERKDYFVKDIDGECASYVRHIRDYNDYLAHKAEFVDKDVIFQERVIQCDVMNQLNSGAVNTMRTATCRIAGRIEVLASEVRVGTKHTGSVDNAAAGGILIGVKDDGCLREQGFVKPGHSESPRIEKHPDTGITFDGFVLPDYDKAIALVRRAHELLYGIHSVGWDIAFSVDGPVLIEGNDNWEITGLQACNRGLKREWLQAIHE